MNGNGRLDDAGRPLEFGTGLSHGAQLDAIQNLMRFGVLIEVAPNNRDNHGRLWELNLDESRSRFDLMEERRAQAEVVNRRRTAKARQTVAATRDAGQAAAVHAPARPALSPTRRRATQERAGRLLLLPVDNSGAAGGGLAEGLGVAREALSPLAAGRPVSGPAARSLGTIAMMALGQAGEATEELEVVATKTKRIVKEPRHESYRTQ